jgi:hypothetical protein
LCGEFADILNTAPPFEGLIDAKSFLDADGVEEFAPFLSDCGEAALGFAESISEHAESHAAGCGAELFALQDFEFGDALGAVADAIDHFSGGGLPFGAGEFMFWAAAVGDGHALDAFLELAEVTVGLAGFVGEVIKFDANRRIEVVAETILDGPPEDTGKGEGCGSECSAESPGWFCAKCKCGDAKQRQQSSDPAHNRDGAIDPFRDRFLDFDAFDDAADGLDFECELFFLEAKSAEIFEFAESGLFLFDGLVDGDSEFIELLV